MAPGPSREQRCTQHRPRDSCHGEAPAVQFLTATAVAQRSLDESFREERCGHCLRVFYACSNCDHGQLYCPGSCKEDARTLSKRAARTRHQESPEGREDHREAQQRYRDRCAERLRVTDQGGREVDKTETVPARMEPSAELPAEAQPRAGSGNAEVARSSGVVWCAFCGRESRWVRHDFLSRLRSRLPDAGAG